MKKIALLLVLILLLCSAGCKGTSKQQAEPKKETKNAFASPANIDGYQRADFDKFNSPAEENGLGGTQIYVDGVFEKVFEVEDGIYGRLKSGNNKWSVVLNPASESSVSELSFLEEKNVRVFGVYYGFAENFDMPSLICVKFTLSDTGACYNIAELSSSIAPIFEAELSSAIEAGKKLNPQNAVAENHDNLDNITVSDFIAKLEEKSGKTFQCIDETVVDEFTAYIYDSESVSVHIKKNSVSGKISNISAYFNTHFDLDFYCNIVQLFDTSVSKDESINILNSMKESIKADMSVGVYKNDDFLYTIYLTDIGTIKSLSISIANE